ncbi:MAG: sodium:solute symporter family protein [Bacillota bacterium]
MDAYSIGIGVYLVALLVIGFICTKFVKTFEDFALMGRRVKPWLIVATISASWYGAGTVSGLPSLAFRSGMTTPFMWLMGASLGYFIVITLAPRVNRTKLITVPDILEARYGPAARYLGLVGVLGTWSTYIGYQIIAIGWILDVALGIPPVPWGFILGFGIVLIYTVAGGLYAVVWTDFIQAMVMIVGITLMVPVALSKIGGVAAATAAITAVDSNLFNPFGVGFLTAIGFFLMLFGLAVCDPTTHQRLLACESDRSARKAAYAALFMPIFFYTLIPIAALMARVLFPDIPNPEYTLLWLARYLLPAIVGVPLMVAVVATVMSTADSALNICSTLIINDIYKRLINPKASEQRLVFLSRVFVVVWAIYGLVLAFALPGVLAGLRIAYSIMAGVVSPAFLAAFLWRRATPAGGVASLAVGLVTLIYSYYNEPFGLSPVIPTMLLGWIALIVVSLATAPPEDEQVRLFMPPRKTISS